MNFSTTGTFNSGNTFSAVLSDAAGTSFPTPLTTVSSTATSLTVTIPAGTVAGTTYKVRVDGSSPATTGTPSGNFEVTAPATTPTLTANPTALTGFTYVEGFGPSQIQSYRLTGNNLPANSTVTVTAPTNYEVSQDNATFGSGFTVSNFSTTDVYVRLKGGLPVGTYNNELVVNTGGGAAQLDVPLSGSVAPPNSVPAISSLSPNTAVAGSGNFTLTIDGTGFISGSTVSFNGTDRATTFVSATRLTVAILAADIATPGTFDVVVTNAAPGGGASAAAPFTVTAPVATLTATQSSLSFSAQVGTTSISQSYTLNGSNLPASSTVTITAPAAFEVSVTSATTGFAETQTATTTAAGSLSRQVWVRFVAPATPGTTGPADVTNVIGSTSVAVAVTGNATAPPSALKWDGGGDGTSFADAQNWAPDVVPATGDDVLLDHSLVTTAYTVTLPAVSSGTLSLGSLVINPDGGAAITAILPNTNTANDYLRFTKAADALVIYSGGTFINSSASGSGTPVDVQPAGENFIIYNGGTYVHNTIRSASTLIDNLSAASGTENGNFQYDVPSGTSQTLSLSGRSYGNLVLRATAQAFFTYSGAGGSGLIIRGNLDIAPNVTFNPALTSNLEIRGDLLNAGRFRFVPSNSTTRRFLVMNGTAAQTISGSPLTLSNTGTSYLGFNVMLRIDNPAGVTLATSVVLNSTSNTATTGGLDLVSGLLTTSATNLLTFASGTEVLGGSNTSFVNGPVARQADAAGSLLFPVGKGTAYRPLTVNVASQAAGTVTYTAEQKERANPQTFDNAASTLDPLTRVSNIRRYTVTSSDNTGFNGNIQLSFGADDDVNNPASPSLVIGKNNGNGWFNIGSVTSDASTVTSGNFTSFSDFALASTDPDVTNNPLPVELIRFTAQRQADAVRLDWATASEQNNARFEVQRSADGVQFRTLSTVAGQGTTTQRHTYSALDRQPLPATAYYRLRQVDTNGQASFSPVVAVAAGKELALYPNPAHTELQVVAPAPEATYRVLSTIGAVLLEGRTSTGSATLNVASLPAGLYHLEVTTATGRVVRKFTKQE
ncbi:T9SS type A sorting domain-containing protein [Hymenobacter sp. APR13]|uniref:T9SS type A sorting domain-containing protein n=1 Tax=Hymenobacter sp. APR13 TaxID=1356852 RepID=UPI0004E0A6C5|nr:T9SS type A sorting domain-containing protein [Hymenobacter sp. APR13]AII53312.1 hypothetical protein N008_15160 [Hymenobacter sp. APR13]